MPTYRDTFPEFDLVTAVREDMDLPEAQWLAMRAAATPYQRRCAHLIVDPTCAPHGEPGTYANWGCRCDPCTKAYASNRTKASTRKDFAEDVPVTPDDMPDKIRQIKEMQQLGQTLTPKAEKLLSDWEAEHVI